MTDIDLGSDNAIRRATQRYSLLNDVSQVHWTVIEHANGDWGYSSARFYDMMGGEIRFSGNIYWMELDLFALLPAIDGAGVVGIDFVEEVYLSTNFADEETDIDAYLLRDYLPKQEDTVPTVPMETVIDNGDGDIGPVASSDLEGLHTSLAEYMRWLQYKTLVAYWFPSAVTITYRPAVWYDGDGEKYVMSSNIKLLDKHGHQLDQRIIDDLDKRVYWAMMSDEDKTRHIEWFNKWHPQRGLAAESNPFFLKTLTPWDDYANAVMDLPFEWDDSLEVQPEVTLDLKTIPAAWAAWQGRLYKKVEK